MSNYEININPSEVDPNGTKYSGNTNKLPSGEFTQVTPDWNQNDKNDPAYVKNRTHWIDGEVIHKLPEVFLPESVVTQIEKSKNDISKL